MDSKIAKKTQDTLGKIIKKPPLTEKLLGKPPFRFLHDIVTSVIKTTGFMQGLFTEAEMNSENVKDKDSKIAFLQKSIDMVCAVTGKELGARPVKIVAGHEPEKTNEFLQALADAINKNVDNQDYVRRVLKGGGGTTKEDKKVRLKSEDERKREDLEEKEIDKNERKHGMDRDDQVGDRKRERDREKDQHREKKQDREKEKDRHGERKHDRDGDTDRQKHKDRERESKKREKSREGDRDRDRHKDHDRESKSRDKSREERLREKDAERSKKRDQSRDKENESPDREKINGKAEEKQEPLTRIQRPASAKGTRRRREGRLNGDDQNELNEDDEEATNQREPMLGEGDLPPQVVAARQLARPSSARPAPPRPKQETLESEPAMRLGSGHPTNVITDNDDADGDDDNFLVQETALPPPDLDLTPLKPLEDQDTKHGALVQKMLESKKEVEKGNFAKKTEIERPLISDAQRRKQREAVQKEVDKLRSSIQSLTRSANPLGKVMDYVQEDMDSMQQELDRWKTENAQHALDLKREMNVTDRAIDPLRQQLAELDRAINDQLDRIATTKSNIIRNDQKIQKMLRAISSS